MAFIYFICREIKAFILNRLIVYKTQFLLSSVLKAFISHFSIMFSFAVDAV